MILPEMHYEWLFLTKTIYDPEVFWVMVTALMTALLVIGTFVLARMSYLPLVKAQQDEIRTRRAVLAERFRDELLQPAAQKIFFLAAHGFLQFEVNRRNDEDHIGYFTMFHVEPNILQQRLDQITEGQQIVMTFEMDDRILSPLQEVAYYEARGAIDFEDVFRIFADHIDVCFANKEIVKYVAWIRERAPAVYKDLEKLHKKIKHHDALRKAKQ
jgi:hypothetical protein